MNKEAQRAAMSGIQEWLSFYFKSPMTTPGLYPEHDLFIPLMKLKNTLCAIRGEEPSFPNSQGFTAPCSGAGSQSNRHMNVCS
jgi:hypothetical protein